MKITALIVCGLLTGCDRTPTTVVANTPGTKLEAAAVAAGLVPDVVNASLTGSYAHDTDRVCVVPGTGANSRIGALIDFGDGQGCAASGTVTRAADRLRVSFGDCRFDARFDGERIVFPTSLPAACDTMCTGRASLAALDVGRLSDSASEARTLRGRRGEQLCPNG